jgi:hypothetical protein
MLYKCQAIEDLRQTDLLIVQIGVEVSMGGAHKRG